jgi:hypothetical protein
MCDEVPTYLLLLYTVGWEVSVKLMFQFRLSSLPHHCCVIVPLHSEIYLLLFIYKTVEIHMRAAVTLRFELKNIKITLRKTDPS